MRHTLLHARIEHGLHKHPHESPVTFPIEFTDWNDHKTIQHISLADCPLLTIMPVYEYPGILRDIPADETNFGIISANHSDDADDLFKKLLQRDGVKSVEVKSGGIDTWIFSRWLAKISYSFSVACLGYDNICHSPLAEIVRQHTLHFGHLIGGVNDLCLPSQDFKLEPPVDAFFNIELTDYATDDGKIFWATRIRLMPILKTPTYFLVVGERR